MTLSKFGMVIFIVLFALTGQAWSAIIQVPSCEYADVRAAINKSSDGDTVIMAAGNCTWNTTVAYGEITVLGAGMGKTVITSTAPTAIYLSKSSNSVGITRLGGFTLRASGSNGVVMAHGSGTATTPAKYIVINQIDFASSPRSRFITTDTNSNGLVYGVISRCQFVNPNTSIAIQVSPIVGSVEYPYTASVMAGNTMWAMPFKSGSDEGIYIEGCKFNFSVPDSGAFDGWYGAKVYFRFNEGTCVHGHGHSPMGTSRGTQWLEAYNNNLNGQCSGGQGLLPFRLRAGSGYFFNNIVYGYEMNKFCIETARAWDSTFNVPYPYMCNGTRHHTPDYDGSGGGGYPCLDGCGRVGGAGIGIFTEATPQKSVPARAWKNGTKAMDGSVPVARWSDSMCAATDLSNDANAPAGYTPLGWHPALTMAGMSGRLDFAKAGIAGYGLYRDNSPDSGGSNVPVLLAPKNLLIK